MDSGFLKLDAGDINQILLILQSIRQLHASLLDMFYSVQHSSIPPYAQLLSKFQVIESLYSNVSGILNQHEESMEKTALLPRSLQEQEMVIMEIMLKSKRPLEVEQWERALQPENTYTDREISDWNEAARQALDFWKTEASNYSIKGKPAEDSSEEESDSDSVEMGLEVGLEDLIKRMSRGI